MTLKIVTIYTKIIVSCKEWSCPCY